MSSKIQIRQSNFHLHALRHRTFILVKNIFNKILNYGYSSKCFAEIYRAQYENAILVYLCGTPIWRPENSVNIWNLLWLSRRLIISTEEISIYISTFPNSQTSKRAQHREISIFFFNKLDHSLVSHTCIIQKFKMLWFPNEASY